MSLIKLIKISIKLFNWTQNEKQNRAEKFTQFLISINLYLWVLGFWGLLVLRLDFSMVTREMLGKVLLESWPYKLLMRCFNLVSVFKEINNLIKEMSHLNHYFIKINLYWLCLTWIALYLVNSVLSAHRWPWTTFLVTKLQIEMGLVVWCKFRLNPTQTVRSKKVPCGCDVTSTHFGPFGHFFSLSSLFLSQIDTCSRFKASRSVLLLTGKP